MAQVPYAPVPTVDPIGGGTPKLSTNVPEGAFGENVGKAVSTLGGTVANIGDEWAKRAIAMQELANETEAKELESKYIIKAGELRAEYTSLMGRDAVDGYKPYMEKLRIAREEIRATTQNEAVQKKFDGPSLNTMSYTIYQGAGHAAAANRQYAIQGNDAIIEANRVQALNYPEDDIGFRRGISKTIEAIRHKGDLAGAPPEAVDVEAKAQVSGLWASRIEGVARKDPFAAQRMFDNAVASQRLLGDDIAKAERTVQTHINATGSVMVADEVSRELPEGTLEERASLGANKAQERYPDNVIFKRNVRNAIDAEWNRKIKIEKDNEFNDNQVIAGALRNGTGPDGKLPSTVAELIADPKVEAAYRDLPETKKRDIDRALALNAKGDVILTPARRLKIQALRGMAVEDQAQFLEQNINAVDIPLDAKDKLIDMQRKLKAKPGTDPRISKVMQSLGNELRPAGVLSNADTRKQYIGALWDELDDFEKEHKKPPTKDEALEIGRRLLQQVPKKDGWTLWGAREPKDYVFRMPVPAKDYEEIKSLVKASKDRDPTDEEIQRIYAAKIYKELYGRSPSSAAPAQPPASTLIPVPVAPAPAEPYKPAPAPTSRTSAEGIPGFPTSIPMAPLPK